MWKIYDFIQKLKYEIKPTSKKLISKQNCRKNVIEIHAYVTPLMMAAKYGMPETFFTLIQAGADPCFRNNNISSIAQTMLHFVALNRAENAVEILRWIIERCPSFVNLPDKFGQTALHIAALNNNTKISQQLLVSGASVSLGDWANRTALWISARNGNFQTVELLLNWSSDPNHQDSTGKSVLMAAIESGELATIQLLTRNGLTNVSLVDHFGRNALMEAAQFGTVPIFDWFLKNGANPNSRDYDGFPVLHFAITSKNFSDEKIRLLFEQAEVKKQSLKTIWTVNRRKERLDALIDVARFGTEKSLEIIHSRMNHRPTDQNLSSVLHHAVVSKIDSLSKVNT